MQLNIFRYIYLNEMTFNNDCKSSTFFKKKKKKKEGPLYAIQLTGKGLMLKVLICSLQRYFKTLGGNIFTNCNLFSLL